MWTCVLALLSAALVYTYLGAFSYYLADDYCEAVRVTESSPIKAVIERYSIGAWRAANRYSNLLLVGIGESFGKNNMPISIISMIVLWFCGLTWIVHELRNFFKLDWAFQTDLFGGLMFGFFSFLQAPSLFQTIYWRSAMMTHFAPLVFGSFLFAFLIKQARPSGDKPLPLLVYLFILIATFFIAGFSEPPITTALTAQFLLMPAIWIWDKTSTKQKRLALLAWTLAGTFLGLLAMLLSPASAGVAREKTLNIIELLMNSFLFSFQFIVDSLKAQPLPTFLSVLIPLMLIWLYRQVKTSELTQEQKRAVWTAIIVIPFFAWILIAAGFSPSVYGQNFPVERARFLARTVSIAAFMLEGSLFGLLLGHVQLKPNRALGQWVVAAVIAVIAIVYPLRTAFNIYRFDIPEYRERAEWWHLREDYIIRHAGMGEDEIVIPGYSGIYQVKELDDDPNHWVNRCAARYYGVNSIRTVSMTDETFLREYLNE